MADGVQKITGVVEILRPKEIRLIQKYYELQPQDENPKRLLLFNLIVEGEVKNDTEAIKKLGYKNVCPAFLQIKKRLLDDILKLILTHEWNQKFDSPIVKAEFYCKRNISIAQVLFSRGNQTAAVAILNKALLLAVKFELPYEQVIICEFLRNYYGQKEGLSGFLKYEESINGALEFGQMLLRAKELYHRIILPNVFKAGEHDQFLDYTKMAIEELEGMSQKTSSARIRYYLYYLSVFYYEMRKNWPIARLSAQSLLDLVSTELAVKSDIRIATANLQLGGILVNHGDYATALNHAKLALSGFRPNLQNYLTTLELLFYTCFRLQEYKTAVQYLKMAKKHPFLLKENFSEEKWKFFESNLLFVEKNFEKALQLLAQTKTLIKDRTGWQFGSRLLTMMILLEQGTVEILVYHIANFRNLLVRQKKKYPRENVILNCWTILLNSGFRLQYAAPKLKETLGSLASDKGRLRWDPLGYEVIRFDDWLTKKIRD